MRILVNEGSVMLEENEDYSQVVKEFIKELNSRSNGKPKRSLGFDSLDSFIDSPAGKGEMTILAGESGSGKSLFSLAMEIGLLRKNTCVAKLSLEMTNIRNHERLFSMLLGKDKSYFDSVTSSEKSKVEFMQELMKQNELLKRYYFNDNPNVSLEHLPKLIPLIQNHFKSLNLLPDDGYFVLIIDLLSLISDWGVSQIEIQSSIDKLHRIIKSLPVHLIGIVQTNENDQRSGSGNKNGLFQLGLKNLKGSAAYKERARDVLILNRPKLMKAREEGKIMDNYFDNDIMRIHIAKSNDGRDGYADFVFTGVNGLSIIPIAEYKSMYDVAS
ncbi:DnaB-like helicase C-terminal domain-containing protein [Leptospira alstonii]|uniref:DnaB-like helicase C-terminal domain-containing protein n=1 Tax=Leptospira alstonii TaxID=28452 RepID=UPI001F242E94|nr:DnaB-like helicase C-terminal domain-containing protein [Leptospira alstonii]